MVFFAMGNSSCHGCCATVLRRIKSTFGSPSPQPTPLSGDLISDRRNQPFHTVVALRDDVSSHLHHSGIKYTNVVLASSKLPQNTNALIKVTNLKVNRGVIIVSVFQKSYNPIKRVIHRYKTFQDLMID